MDGQEIPEFVDKLPTPANELLRAFFESDIQAIISNLDDWNGKFRELSSVLTEEDNSLIWRASNTHLELYPSFYHTSGAIVEIEVKLIDIVLFLYLLAEISQKWCRLDRSALSYGANRVLTKITDSRAVLGNKWSLIKSAAEKCLSRRLHCHLSNRHSISDLVKGKNVSFSNRRVVFFSGGECALNTLINYYESDPKGMLAIQRLTREMSDADAHEFGLICDQELRVRWNRLSGPYLAAWWDTFRENVSSGNWTPVEFIDAFAPIREDGELWLDGCIKGLAGQLFISNQKIESPEHTWKECISKFQCWSGKTAKQLFEVTSTRQTALWFEPLENILGAENALTREDRVCLALLFLMREHDRMMGMKGEPDQYYQKEFRARRQRIAALEQGESIFHIVELLKDLPSPNHHYDRKPEWLEFGPDEKAAWRAEVREALSKMPAEMRYGVIEVFLWHIRSDGRSRGLYSEIEPLILALCQTEEDILFLTSLESHISRLVQVRASALLARLGRRSSHSPLTPLEHDGVTITAAKQAVEVVAAGQSACRTWMQDRAVEGAIFGAIERTEREFVAAYEHEWRLEEEMHVATLLTRLQQALKGTNGILDALAAHGVGVAPSISLSFRQISKHEEGRAGVGAERFSVDVAFIVHVTDAGTEIAKRVTLVQCKKLKADKSGNWSHSFDLERQQCDDLIQQSEASFYLFITPAFVGSEVWMTPARLVRNLCDLHGTKGTLPRIPAYYASRSLAHWMTYDLFGLWTGDERVALAEKAQGEGPGYSPRFVVSVKIHRNPTRDEAPQR